MIHTKSQAVVSLLSFTPYPIPLIARVTRTYDGILNMDPMDNKEIAFFLDKATHQHPQTVLEMVHFLFLIQDVTRAFTHQIVRYRVGISFAQESLRFSVKDNVRTLLTQSLMQHPENLKEYAAVLTQMEAVYHKAIKDGVNVEDARAILPTNVLTSLFVDMSLKTLAAIYFQRSCCQAQPGEWSVVLDQMARHVRLVDPRLDVFLKTPGGPGRKCVFHPDPTKPCKYETSEKPTTPF